MLAVYLGVSNANIGSAREVIVGIYGAPLDRPRLLLVTCLAKVTMNQHVHDPRYKRALRRVTKRNRTKENTPVIRVWLVGWLEEETSANQANLPTLEHITLAQLT